MCGQVHSGCYDRRQRQVRDLTCGDMRVYLEIDIRRMQCRRCGAVKFAGVDRKEASMMLFYDSLGERKTRGIRLAVMDIWKPFRNATRARAPQAAILFDKFHIISHLGDALDKVRKVEYLR